MELLSSLQKELDACFEHVRKREELLGIKKVVERYTYINYNREKGSLRYMLIDSIQEPKEPIINQVFDFDKLEV